MVGATRGRIDVDPPSGRTTASGSDLTTVDETTQTDRGEQAGRARDGQVGPGRSRRSARAGTGIAGRRDGPTPGHGRLVVSLDFELYWGVRDQRSIADYRANLLGVRDVVPRLLELFERHGIRVTW